MAGWTLRVRDEGQGLTDLEQSRIFDKFYRARRDHDGIQGTGMGLAIAREIAEAHGGAVGVESQLGKGSSFHGVFARGAKGGCRIERIDHNT